jgi:glycosyltransferase involved in cell wall biosynthesis
MWRAPGSKVRSVADTVFAIPGDLAAPTGGYGYARRVLEALPGHGVSIRHLALPNGFPEPSDADLSETARLLSATPRDAVLLIDGLAYGAMPSGVIDGLGRAVVALVHHPLGLETGLPPACQAALIASETSALARAAHVIVTSPVTARTLHGSFEVPAERITVAEPGTDAAPRSRGTGAPVRLLSVGTVSPRKGYDVLVTALQSLTGLDWRATIAGAVDRAPDAAERLRRSIDQAGLADRVALVGALGHAALEEHYARADVLVSPSLFEGYGMALAEALAHGLPIVASTGGAAVETVPDAAALKVPPGDAAALANALRRAIGDRSLRAALGDASWSAGQRLPSWSDTASRIAAVLRQVAR